MSPISLYLWLTFFSITQWVFFWDGFWSPWHFPNYSRCLPSGLLSISLGFFWRHELDRFEFGLGTTGPFFLTLKVLSPELSLSWFLKLSLMARQWSDRYKVSNSSTACALGVWIYCLHVYKNKCTHSLFSVCVSMHANACRQLLQCALWQDVSHRSHTDPDCSSHYNIRGYPVTWKPSNHSRAEQLAQTRRLTLMGLLQSKLE